MDPNVLHGSLAAIGLGLIVIGAALGIGKIGAAAMDGIARQPEAEKLIKNNMILAAVLVEGVAIIALGLCFMTIK